MKKFSLILFIILSLIYSNVNAQRQQSNGTIGYYAVQQKANGTGIFAGINTRYNNADVILSTHSGNSLSNHETNYFYLADSRISQIHVPSNTAKSNNQVFYPDSLTLYSMSDTLRMSASYNQKGWNDKILTQVWFGGHWLNYELRTWTYLNVSTESNLTLKQTWSDGQWQNTELDSSTYDANGNMLVHLFKYWYQGAWRDSILSNRTYDANGNMLTNEGWYLINNQWTNFDLITYTYDNSGNILSSLFQFWNGGVWVNSDLYTYTHDENGHLLTILHQSWNGQWQNATLSTYTYDSNGNMLSFLFQTSASDQWTNLTLDTYTYDANGKMLTDWLKGWTNGAWMNGTHYTYNYDTNENMVNKLIQYWLNGLWTNFYQTLYTYDSNGNMITGNNTMWTGSSWIPVDNSLEIKINGESYNFTGYSIGVSYILTNITDVSIELNGVIKEYSLSQNYPNPFNPTTTVNYSVPKSILVTIKVFDILGREIAILVNEQKSPGNYNVQFNGSKLSSGVYFYRMQAGDFVQTKKILLMK